MQANWWIVTRRTAQRKTRQLNISLKITHLTAENWTGWQRSGGPTNCLMIGGSCAPEFQKEITNGKISTIY